MKQVLKRMQRHFEVQEINLHALYGPILAGIIF